MIVKFNACEYLDYEPHYGNCKRQMISCGETKLCWRRTDDLVQFCKKRGRINNPVGCLEKANAVCRDYTEVVREIDVPEDELEN